MRAVGGLTARQRALLARWVPGARVERDHSWGLVGTTVLELAHGTDRYIAKAGDASDHHLAREIHAHRTWLTPWTSAGRAPELVHADEEAKLLLTRYLPGTLVEGTAAEHEPGTYRQAGALLAQLHAQGHRLDPGHEARENARTLAWLDGPHRIEPAAVRELRRAIEAWDAPPTTVVATHGDWHPRNWLVHEGVVAAIDLGRAAVRPPATDLTRLAARQFRSDPRLETAFLDGYGRDPREAVAWHRQRVREAVGTAAWAFQVGDERFEQQGHRMIAEVLADL